SHAQGVSADPSSSAARVDEVLAEINRARSIGQVAVSPDGKHVAFVLAGEIRVAPLGNLTLNLALSRRITAATPGERCIEGNLAWSPDSALLAFTSVCAQPGQQSDLYLSRLDENPPTRFIELPGGISAPAFSPDGRALAFLYVEGATRPAGAQAAMKPPSGVIGEDGIEIQSVAKVTLPSPLNCELPKDTPENRALGEPAIPCLVGLFSFLTPPHLHVYEFDWSPDSSSIAYIAADPPGEDNWWLAKLYTQSLFGPTVESASTLGPGRAGWEFKPTVILSPSDISGPLHGLQIALPRWSPDGKSIAFVGGLMSDQGVTGGDVWLVPAAGGDPRDLTADDASSSEWIEWVDDH